MFRKQKLFDNRPSWAVPNVDDFSNVNKTRIKVLSSYLCEHVDVRHPVDKKTYQRSKTFAFMQWKAAAKAI